MAERPVYPAFFGRRYFLLDLMKSRGRLTLAEISKLVKPHVSEPTLRSDFKELCALPLVETLPGSPGLVARPRSVFANSYFGDNLTIKTATKMRLARHLVSGPFDGFPLLNLSGDILVAGPGSSTLAVLRVLVDYPSIEILTTNLGVLEVPDILKSSLHFSGGWVLPSVGSLVGSAAVRSIEAFPARHALVGVSGICIEQQKSDPDVLLYCHHEAQLDVKQALIRNREKVIVVSCGEKVGKRDAWPYASVSEILKESDLYIMTDLVQEGLRKELCDRLKVLSSKAGNHKATLIELPKDGRGLGAKT